MADLIKTENGMLYEDDFSSNSLLWQLSPADYSKLEYTENGLKIKRSTDYTTLSIREPERSRYSFFCEIEHHPFDDKDIAGVIIMSNSDQYAECQSLKLGIPSGYNNPKAMKDYILSLINDYLDSKNLVTFSYNDDEDPGIDFRIPSEINNKTEWTEYYMRLIDDIVKERFVTWNYEEINGLPQDENKDINKGQIYEEAVEAAISALEDFEDKQYKYIKYDKIGGLYSFYASVDGTQWIEIGNTSFKDAGRIGFFLYGSDDEEAINANDFMLKKMVFYKNRYITVDGMKDEHKFSIYQDGKEIVASDSWAVQKVGATYLIDTYKLPIPFSGDFIVSEEDKVICLKTLENVYGGDTLTLTYNFDVYVNNVKILPEQIFDLGVFTVDTKTFKVDIYNKEEIDLNNITISVEAYSEYYSGSEPIAISIYDEANEIVNFQKELIIDKIPATQGKSILIGLDPKSLQNFYDAADSYRFKLNIR